MNNAIAAIGTHLNLALTHVDTLQAENDELRRLLRRCLPGLNEVQSMYSMSEIEWLDYEQLIDLINASAPEPPAPDPTPDHDGDMLNDVPF